MRAVAWGVIRPAGDDRPRRLADLCRRLDAVLAEHQPSEAAMETPFAGRNPKSAIALAEVRGAILARLGEARLEVTGLTPASVKQSIVGTGRAEKGQVAFMVVRLLGLEKAPASDASDALGVAITHIHLSRLSSIRTWVSGR